MNMKATLNKHLHERALAIIELIEMAERRIEQQKENSKIFSLFPSQTEVIIKRIATHAAAIERLEKSYIETVNRINKAI